jgi:hypothetical protein
MILLHHLQEKGTLRMGMAGFSNTLTNIAEYTQRRIPAKRGFECERYVTDEIKINDAHN